MIMDMAKGSIEWTFWGATMWPLGRMITALLRGIVPVELLS